MVGLLAFTGMAIDVGYLQWTRVRIQDAADAAAQAALIEAKNNTGNQVTAGRANAALNGYTNGQNGVTVTINQPPTVGSLTADQDAVEAIVTQTVPTFFMRMLNTSSVTVSARAAGSYAASSGSSSSGSSLGCVYILDTSSSDSQVMNVQGSSPTFNCGVVVESPNSQAVYLSGALTVTIGTGYTLGVVGPSGCTASQPAMQTNCGIDYTSNQDYICSTGNSTCTGAQEPTANGIANPGDPLSTTSVPAFGTTFSAKNYYDMNSQPVNNTLQPGIYCGGLTIGNTNGATYTLNPGTYIIAGGNLEFNSTGTVSGTGVTFYLTSPADVASTTGTSCPSSLVTPTSTTMAKLNINGQPNVKLTAPASGASTGIAGVLFFENRSSTTDNQPQIVGNSTTSLNGAMYFKNSTLTFSGVNGSNTGFMMIVVKKLTVNGSSPIVVYNVGNPLGSSSSGTALMIEE
jgi:Putative Flp pilus-assembly TadE/G-like